ncbi:hypothetical protein TL16_g04067 [Triparma laevis f. inornata]|uniref:3-oxo-5-alpha-steroid 4-dehydrogenase C-terminal domain-containing protein n=2 Tax=Triparma laevis TaxID=1534972 RepID=A0A9W7A6F3_9STRA|nr:hypothetical protein TrLO_g14597 [Triparma laevis f. longispina]GMH64885.1 hypothetical protein TL16_g04067 [Triparma laevis f. inornata]
MLLPSIGAFVPPPNLAFSAIAAVQVSSVIATLANSGAAQAPYSKFALDVKLDKPIPSKIGMLLIYSPATAYSLYALLNSTVASVTLIPLLLAHFTKRIFEVLFVHKYSGDTSLPLASLIGIYYALMSALIVSTPATLTNPTMQTIGLALFGVGFSGNFFHHVLLSNLRKEIKSEEKHVMPVSGLFNYAAAPHYMFELIGWLGIGLTSQSLNGMLVFATMTSYLGERAKAQNAWNLEKWGEKWGENKKNMVPGIW